jgi:hypothetical protein
MLQDAAAFYVSHNFLSRRPRPTQGCTADDDDYYYYFISIIQSMLPVTTIKGKTNCHCARREGV